MYFKGRVSISVVIIVLLAAISSVYAVTVFQDTFSNETNINESLQSETTGGVLQNEVQSGSNFYLESRTTSEELLSGTSSAYTGFKFTVAKKPADTIGKVKFSNNFDNSRSNVIDFDDTARYITISDHNDFDVNQGSGNEPLTIMFWVKLSDATTAFFVNKTNNGSSREYLFQTNGSDLLRFSMFNNNTTGMSQTGPAITNYEGDWALIAAAYNGGTDPSDITLYINGINSNDSTSNGGFTGAQGSNPVYIGRFGSSYINGDMADLRFYRRELSQNEILNYYRDGIEPSSTSLVARYPLNEGSGSTANDSTGSHDGSITSALWTTDSTVPYLVGTWQNGQGQYIKIGSYDFDGTDDYIDIGDTSQTINAVSFWVEATDSTSENIIDLNGTQTITTDASDQITANSFTSPTYYVDGVLGDRVIKDGRWHHVLVKTGTSFSASNMDIGRVASSYFDGKISDVRIYNTEPSDDEVWELYSNSIEQNSANLVGHWKFNYDGGDDAIDSALDSINHATGTVTGSPVQSNVFGNIPHIGHALGTSTDLQTYRFDGTNDYIDIGDTSATIQSISFDIKIDDATSQSIIDLDGGTHTITTDSSDQITANGFTSPTYYVDGVSGDRVITDNNWHKILITTGTGFSASDVDVGRISSTYVGGEIANVALWTDARSSGEATTDFQNGYAGTSALSNYWPLDGNATDGAGSSNGTANGVTTIRDLYRPQPEAPTQQTISLSGYSTSSEFYYRTLFNSNNASSTFALTEVTLENSVGGVSNNAPTDITLSTSTQVENTATSTTIGTLTTTDADGGDSHTYSLACTSAGADDSHFSISSDALQNAAPFNYESPVDANTDNSYQICIRTSDGTDTYDENFTITVTNINEAPVITSNGGGATATTSVAENSTTVTTVTSTDDDSGDSAEYSISGGVDSAFFTISTSTGLLGFLSAPDFSNPQDSGSNNTYIVEVQVSDSSSATDTQEITVTVTEVNVAPTDITLSTSTIIENSSANTVIGALTTTDSNSGDTHTYSLACASPGVDDSDFNINGSDLRNTTVFNFESPVDDNTDNSYQVCIRTTDDGAGNLTYDENFTITVTNINEAPVITSNGGGATATTSVAENSTTVTTVVSTDVDASDTATYSISGGLDSSKFTINSSSGILGFSSAPDFENPTDTNTDNDYVVEVQVSDSSSATDTQEITVTVTNAANEVPTDISLSTSTIAENSATSTTVGSLSTTDADGGDTHTYSLVSGSGDTDNASFSISSNNLQLAISPDFETKSSYSIRIRTTDSGTGNLTYDESFTVTITNVAEDPWDISITSQTIDENSASGTIVGTLSTTDDSGDTHTYSLACASPGVDDSSFSISSNDLQTSFVPDFETKASYAICIRTTDQTARTFDENFTITVNDINESTSSGGGGSRRSGSQVQDEELVIYGCTDIGAVNYDSRDSVTHTQSLCIYQTSNLKEPDIPYFTFESDEEDSTDAELEVIDIDRVDLDIDIIEGEESEVLENIPETCSSIYLSALEITTYLNRFSKEGIELTSCDISTFSPDQLDRMLEARSFDRFSDEPADDKKYYDLSIAFVDDSLAPIEGLKVTLFSEPRVTLTNSEGVAFFRKVEEGDHEVIVDTSDGKTKSNIILSGDKEVIQLKVLVVEEHSALAWWLFGFALIIIILLLHYITSRGKKKTSL